MRKLLVITILGILILPGTLMAQELKITGEIWNRWTLQMDSEDEIVRNNFSVERGYIGLEPKFSNSVQGRFRVDIFSTDALSDGAGLKLKYAYVDFKKLLPVKGMTTTIGLQKVYFGTIYDWSYDVIGKAPSDEYKIANSADYGLSVHGGLPQDWGEYALGIYNGEGYKKYGDNLKDNINPAFLANLRLTPIEGITLGGSVMANSNQRKELLEDGSDNPNYNDQILIDGLLGAAFGPADIWFEYINKDVKYPNDENSDYTANALMVKPRLNLKNIVGKDIDLIARYDRWEDESDGDNVLTAITGGINYNLPSMQLQLNYTNASNSENGSDDSSTLMLQFKWMFSNSIKI